MTLAKTFGQPVKGNWLSPPRTARTTSDTFVLADAGQLCPWNNSGAANATVPPNSSVAYDVGTILYVLAEGAGALTIVRGAGVTITSAQQGNADQIVAAQGARVELLKVATDTWYASGDLTVTSNVIDRDMSVNDVVSTASKTTIYSFSIPANKLGTNKAICIDLFGDAFNNSGNTRIETFEVKLGSTVMWADAASALTASATIRREWVMRLILTATNATNAQKLGGIFLVSNLQGATTGSGDISTVISSNTAIEAPIGGSATEDSTSALTFTVSITHAISDANLSWRRNGAIAYMLGEGQKGDTGATGAQGSAGVGTGTMPPSANSPQTTNYTAVLADAASFVDMNSGSALTFTIPPHSSVAFANGTVLAYVQLGAGAVTATAGAGVTIKPAAVVSSRQDGWVFLVQKSQDVWGATGDFA